MSRSSQQIKTSSEQRDHSDYLTKLVSPTLDNVLYTVRKRYNNGDFFTKIGENALLVVGGSGLLQESSAEVAADYAKWIIDTTPDKQELPPHVFDMAASCFYHMARDFRNQSVIFLGGAASEKAEIRKLFTWQLLMLSTNTEDTEDQKILLAATMMDPVFEAFTCARTLRSRCASLVCKYVEYQYDHSWKLVGVGTIAYQVDKSRFTAGSTPGEENFPVFYYLLAGASPEEKVRWKLHDAAQFKYLQGSPFFHTASDDMKVFRELQKALKRLRIGFQLQKQMCQLLAAILHLGNIQFADDETRPQDPCHIVNGDVLYMVANLLGVDQQTLGEALVYKSQVIGHERMSLFLTAQMASAQRNFLAATLYSELVNWLVRRINACLCKSYNDQVAASIRVFETPSFRHDAGNEMDRFLYNMVNERLHHFMLDWLGNRCEEYGHEGVLSFAVDSHEEASAATKHLLSRDMGLLRTVDDESLQRYLYGSADSREPSLPAGILDTYDLVLPVAVDETRRSNRAFQVNHYNTPAIYDYEALAALNTESLSSTITSIFGGRRSNACANGFVRNLFFQDDTEDERDAATAISTFANLTDQVMTAVADASPWFVVCADPGESPLSEKIDAAVLKTDLAHNHIATQVQMRVAADYAADYTHEEFIARFHTLLMGSAAFHVEDEMDFASICENFAAEMDWNEEHMALGLTKVFLSEKAWRSLHDRLRVIEEEENDAYWKAQPSQFATTLARPIGDGTLSESEADFESPEDVELLNVAEAAQKAKYILEEPEPKKPLSATRKRWLCCTWSLTWCFLPFCLSICGRMKQKDIQMAWREKLALCLIIFLMCAVLLLFIIGLPLVLCPKQNLLSLDEIRVKTTEGDPYVYGYGKAYQVSSLMKRHENFGADMGKVRSALGKDISGLFYRVDHFDQLCPGVAQKPSPGWDNLAHRPIDYLLQHRQPNSPYISVMQSAAKFDVGYHTEYIRAQPLVNKTWVVLYDKVYDVTTYKASGFFANPAVDRLFEASQGGDITSSWIATVVRPDPRSARAIESCMNNLFYVGIVDHRLDVGCQFSNYVLLASSMVIIGIIGIKFLVAMQFSAPPKLRREELNRFVICQMPCYTEGEASLRKSLESLACMDYDDPRKLLFVICDGMIVGSGNNRPTPRIVLDILEHDPKDDPEPCAFQSVGEGDQQLNRAKVYSGLYRVKKGTQEHSVPYIVVAKIGKETEVARPGNRGKRDSQLLLLKFLSRVHFNAELEPLELELYRTMTEVIGFHPSQYDLLFMLDADTECMPDSLAQFVNCMANDQSIVGICGETVLANTSDSWITRIQVYEYFISHHLTKAFEAIFGAVTCLPGCFCMYRIKSQKNTPILIAPEIVDEFSQNDVDTLHLKNLFHLGEDRFLTTLVLKYFSHMKCTFTAHAKCKTSAPDKWRVLASQRRRWINSTVHNLFELINIRQCGFLCCSMKFVIFLDLLSTVLQPAVLFYLGYLIYTIVSQVNPIPIISIAMIAAIYGLQVLVFILKREFKQIIWMLLYILGIPLFSFLLPVYAFWHFDDFSWGNTRVVYGENGKKTTMAVESRKFDPTTVPKRKWAEHLKQRQMEVGFGKGFGSDTKEGMSKRISASRGKGYTIVGVGTRAVVVPGITRTASSKLSEYQSRGRPASPLAAPFRPSSASPIAFEYTNRFSTSGGNHSASNVPYWPTLETHPRAHSAASTSAEDLNQYREQMELEASIEKAKRHGRDLHGARSSHTLAAENAHGANQQYMSPTSPPDLSRGELNHLARERRNMNMNMNMRGNGSDVSLPSQGHGVSLGRYNSSDTLAGGQDAHPNGSAGRTDHRQAVVRPPYFDRKDSQQTLVEQYEPQESDHHSAFSGAVSPPSLRGKLVQPYSNAPREVYSPAHAEERSRSQTSLNNPPTGMRDVEYGSHGGGAGQRDWDAPPGPPAANGMDTLTEYLADSEIYYDRQPAAAYRAISPGQHSTNANSNTNAHTPTSFAMPRLAERRASQLNLAAHTRPRGTPIPLQRRASELSIATTNVQFPMPHPVERRASELSIGGLVRRRDLFASIPTNAATNDFEMDAMPHSNSESAGQSFFPTDQMIVAEVRRIVDSSDLMVISKKSVRDVLSQTFDCDLESKRQLISDTIDEVLESYARNQA
ncbi:chitin synthase-domain-containing protein [Fimicolochytrium jonesii]|uniref:chitin synthase-domain-containing protein n=1 Tax=Fimicolochytrium jonesii TaxID=1396493 RepID=UPI0022FDF7CC|nr:chitin synthase-domain-containing protein [Fimicolochytrium jonesii]KAI8820137.1 chitin synthase-domain-containing protein [Fimicolochytrium jonesii]